MDLSPTEAEAALRDECRTWLREHLPWEYGKGLPPRFDDLADEVAFGREWQARLAAGRWVGVAWPKEYGGRDAGPVGHYIVTEELARARAPELVGRIGVNLVGPTILAHGTPEQQAELAPEDPRARSSSGASSSASRTRGATCRASRRARRARTAAGCSTARRSGPATRSSPTGGCAWPAPIPTRRRTRGSRISSSTCATPVSRSGRCTRSPTRATSTRSSSPTCSSRRIASSGRRTRGGRSRTQTLTHERGVNPRQLVVHTQLVDELLRLATDNGTFDDERGRAATGRGVRRGPDLPAAQLAFDLAHREGRGTGTRRQHQQDLVE